MTFTFDLSEGFTDLARVRWELGDTDESAPIFQDDILLALIEDKEGWQGAVIAALEYLIATLIGTPGFTADWLKVDTTKAIADYTALLNRKRTEYGIDADEGTLTMRAKTPARGDRAEWKGAPYAPY